VTSASGRPTGAVPVSEPHPSDQDGVPVLVPGKTGRPGRRRGAGPRLGVFTVPAWALVVPLAIVPLLMGVWLSFRDQTLGSNLPSSFVGLDNYRSDVFSPTFVQALLVTLEILAVGLLVQIPIGLLLAVLLERRIRASRAIRSSLITPMLLTPVAVGLMWRFMFNSELGVINWALGLVHLGPVDWLGSSGPALLAVVIVDSWQAIPFVMLMMLAGLAALPSSPREAAAVDGANAWQTFRNITLPMLMPVLLVTVMVRLIDGFKLFDIVFILTRGGPGTATQTVSMLDYNTAFTFLASSRAAAIGTVLAILTLPVYWLWVRASKGIE
jgi:multiple sugar transport system permease protein